MLTKIALNKRYVRNFFTLYMLHALPLEMYVKKEFHGMKEIHIIHEPEDEPLIGWLMNKAQTDESKEDKDISV